MLRREFTRAQDTELKNFEIREKTAAQRFKQNQKLRQSTFDLRERDLKEAGSTLHTEPHPGTEKRRVHERSFLQRRDELKKLSLPKPRSFRPMPKLVWKH